MPRSSWRRITARGSESSSRPGRGNDPTWVVMIQVATPVGTSSSSAEPDVKSSTLPAPTTPAAATGNRVDTGAGDAPLRDPARFIGVTRATMPPTVGSSMMSSTVMESSPKMSWIVVTTSAQARESMPKSNRDADNPPTLADAVLIPGATCSHAFHTLSRISAGSYVSRSYVFESASAAAARMLAMCLTVGSSMTSSTEIEVSPKRSWSLSTNSAHASESTPRSKRFASCDRLRPGVTSSSADHTASAAAAALGVLFAKGETDATGFILGVTRAAAAGGGAAANLTVAGLMAAGSAAAWGAAAARTAGGVTAVGGGTGADTRTALSSATPPPVTTTWALLPVNPKLETPTTMRPLRLGREAPDTSGNARRDPRMPPATEGLMARRGAPPGHTPRSAMSSALRRPSAPAADSRCPNCFLAAVRTHGKSPAPAPMPTVSRRAVISTGSPSLVPVPWHSTAAVSPGVVPAEACAARTTAAWATGSTAVMGFWWRF
mmetsp:Transcript_14410/g.35144  ORF Transcript_14410/g.35144 Transcript_14410/m.35144 type:complete len:492 (+) Transcript_14410:1172-2647(+)